MQIEDYVHGELKLFIMSRSSFLFLYVTHLYTFLLLNITEFYVFVFLVNIWIDIFFFTSVRVFFYGVFKVPNIQKAHLSRIER